MLFNSPCPHEILVIFNSEILVIFDSGTHGAEFSVAGRWFQAGRWCLVLLASWFAVPVLVLGGRVRGMVDALLMCCLLYTSDAADEEDSGDLGGRRIIKKKK
eukprot:TRINITY_DN31578_c0_g1_i1.p3 TRINITY_DN31578_c0_g1~~TRINITY_DN31578_c0_g1_i1.p3  ORF type:complete len:102 (-),score=30.35 TRINITY_DN31578_c0_g1_i1:54-359(-)